MQIKTSHLKNFTKTTGPYEDIIVPLMDPDKRVVLKLNCISFLVKLFCFVFWFCSVFCFYFFLTHWKKHLCSHLNSSYGEWSYLLSCTLGFWPLQLLPILLYNHSFYCSLKKNVYTMSYIVSFFKYIFWCLLLLPNK